ncbi:glycosyltransferase family 2 protein [Cryobacterium sp. 1639]|uniref:glycosyltransferase family 2 protein n=1 Tax=Cryobacterium inferilacus TaxID=2866629 RepID=UPI0027E27453|nr:glycosyltransferase family 2 protein [Cryobacterium sp. 1639]
MSGVSVIVAHYGDPATTSALVAALQAHSEPLIREIIVVDDASPIAFPERLGVNVIRRQRNGGFGAAVNTGASVAVGELIMVLNSDLDIGASFVRDLVGAAAPWQPAVVSPQIVRPSGEAEWVGRHFPRTGHYAVEWLTPFARFRHRRGLHEAVGHDTRCVAGAVVPVDWVAGAAMLIPLAEFRAVNGFDEGFHMNCEEVDLQRRLRSRGVPSVFAGTVTAVHEGGGSSDPARRRRWLVDSRLRYARKWGEGPRRLQLTLAGASLVNFAVNGVRQLARRPIDARRILRDELRLLRGAQ